MAKALRRDNRTRETPPPPIRDGDGTQPAGSEILVEVPGDLGVILWLAIRRVHNRLRVRRPRAAAASGDAVVEAGREDGSGPTPPAGSEQRQHPLLRCGDGEPLVRRPREHCSVGAAAGQVPELGDAIRTFVLAYEVPGQVPAARLAEACGQVWHWADAADRLQTAAHFAEAAAYLDEQSARWANEAGRACRRAAMDVRAAMWFYRGLGLGVRTRQPAQCTVALFRYGVLLHHLGEYDAAEKYLMKAKRRALGGGQRREAAAAHHHLLGVAAEARPYEVGERNMIDALWLYPRNDERRVYLVHDYAYLLCEKRLYSYAAPLVREVIPCVPKPLWQPLLWGNAARAFAGIGLREEYLNARQQALSFAGDHAENASGALTMTAVAAWLMGDLVEAEELASRGLEIARTRKERIAVRRATSVLSGLATRAPGPRHADPPGAHQIELITRQCIALLRKRKPRL
jgi:tetratricopeptide (TPR) repeat protein